MKINKVLILVILFIFYSCKKENKVKTEQKKIIPKKEISIKKESIDYSEINEIIQGIWLPKKYITEITKTKSAFISSNRIPTISELQIDPKNIKNDSLTIISSYGNHEGFNFKVWFENQNGKLKITSKKYVIDYEITKIDTILKLIYKSDLNRKTEYTRIRNSEYITEFGGKGYEYIARKVILNGNYKVLDSLKNDIGISHFNASNGKISEFDYKAYKVLTDYNEPTFEGDNVFLYKDEKDLRNITYCGIKKSNDTIMLYSKKEYFENEEYGEKLDKLMYYLIKH